MRLVSKIAVKVRHQLEHLLPSLSQGLYDPPPIPDQDSAAFGWQEGNPFFS